MPDASLIVLYFQQTMVGMEDLYGCNRHRARRWTSASEEALPKYFTNGIIFLLDRYFLRLLYFPPIKEFLFSTRFFSSIPWPTRQRDAAYPPLIGRMHHKPLAVPFLAFIIIGRLRRRQTLGGRDKPVCSERLRNELVPSRHRVLRFSFSIYNQKMDLPAAKIG